MDAELAVMASSAATTIVSLMATDVWDQVKERIGALWRRFQPEQADAVEVGLDRTRVEIAGGGETVALAISREWEARLLRLLAADAAVADELRQVVAELKQLPAGGQVRGAVQQKAKATKQSTVIQVSGNATIGERSLVRRRLARARQR